MKAQLTCPRVWSVRPLPGKRLHVTFSTGEARVYERTPLLRDEAFRALEDEQLFRQVHPDPHGYAVIWNDQIELVESGLWINGKPLEPDAEPLPRSAIAP